MKKELKSKLSTEQANYKLWDENRMYLLEKIIATYEKSKVDWKGKEEGNRSVRIQQTDYDCCGKERILWEAKELKKQGLIHRIKWVTYASDIEKIFYSLKDMEAIYAMLEKQKKKLRFQRASEFLDAFEQEISNAWMINYIHGLRSLLDNGKIPAELSLFDEMQEEQATVIEAVRNTSLFRCLSGLDKLHEPIYKRIFSKYYLRGSKVFEKELQKKIISIVFKYHSDVEDSMNNTEVLSQIFIEEYAQELAVKGDLMLMLDGRTVDLSLFPYGVVLNSDTMKYGNIAEYQKIDKIITVENKANYMSMPYESGTLIIFTHGYFSPKEREFLCKLADILKDKDVTYWHTGDLDYGGIQIFRYIKNRIFPKLQPYLMDVKQYDDYKHFGEPISDTSLEKLKAVKEPLLQPLIDKIITDGLVIEQESFLIENI